MVSLDGSSIENPAAVATISVETTNPLLIVGLDGKLLESVRFQSAFRTWSYVMSPGKHVLWLSSTPYGYLFPQRHRCYSMEVFVSPDVKYVLKEIPGEKRAMMLFQAGGKPVTTGELVDNPWVFERGCRWELRRKKGQVDPFPQRFVCGECHKPHAATMFGLP